ncbi:MAG TPA: LssY C-terminal domain-containing protein [Candidatus Acidoferrales bacterium]|nr:LssY C-terminal domain-containing protein [Candidatus Acidoferrales bacterium]
MNFGRTLTLHFLAAVILSALVAVSSPPAAAQSGSTASVTSYQLDVDAAKQWLDTKIDLRAGEKLRFTATGTIAYPADKKHPDGRSFGPDGLARGFGDLIHEYAVSNADHGSLIGRLGDDNIAQPFAIGASTDYEAPVAGRLFLGINQSLRDAEFAKGNFQVKIAVLNPGLSTAAAMAIGGPPETPVLGITPALLRKIPRRVSDPQGKPGDMVNILLVGTQEQVLQVFTRAGWVRVDRSVQDAVMNAVIDSLEKKDYLTMPMSTLYLFDHPQDYGFAHAEPVRVAMSRNHLRVWKSPYVLDGRPLWCVAATHDIGFERDERNNSVTHKIDQAIDGEREYVNDTLSRTGLVIERTHVTPADPLTDANTATGGSFHSDGHILVLVLNDANATGKSN